MINIGTNIAKTSQRIGYSPTGGIQTIAEYEGTREACEGFAFQLPSGLAWSIDDNEKPKCKLAVFAPYLDAGNTTIEPPTEIWELPGNTLLKDIYEHPTSLSLGPSVLSAVKRAVEKASNSSSGADAYGDAAGDITAATTFGNERTGALELFDGVLKGHTHYQVSQYVLRHTRIVGQRNAVTLVYSGVGKVYSVAQIDAEDPIPFSLVFAIGNIVAPDTQIGYTWGWLKQTPSVKVVGSGRIEITQEWWLEQWWNRPYPNR